MTLTFASWNVSGLQKLRDQHRLLKQITWDIIALQEVTAEALRGLSRL